MTTLTAPPETAYPHGVRVELDADTVVLDDATLLGGSPARLLRLSPAGATALVSLRREPVDTVATARLARTLTDAGAAHPVLGPPRAIEATVLIPVRDRVEELNRCLSALGGAHPVVVVDDGSRAPTLLAAVCARHGARLVTRLVNGGPAAARNSGLAEIGTEFVLLLDSDCVPPPELVARLAAHFADPLVAAVAPRVRGDAVGVGGGSGVAARYSRGSGALDLGERPARVAPGRRVSYVPTAALLVRRDALERIGGFEEALRYGEDVDLVWRLDAAGWRVRYEPAVVVAHEEPERWNALLRRRFCYGTSAGPLARRHPGTLAPVTFTPWSAVAVAGALTRRPLLAAAGVAGSTARLRRALPADEVPNRQVLRTSAHAATETWFGVSRWATQFATPALVTVLVRPGRRAGGRRAVALALLLSAAARDHYRSRSELDPLRYCAARIVEEAAYGAGVLTGAIRARTLEPLRPILRRAPRSRKSP